MFLSNRCSPTRNSSLLKCFHPKIANPACRPGSKTIADSECRTFGSSIPCSASDGTALTATGSARRASKSARSRFISTSTSSSATSMPPKHSAFPSHFSLRPAALRSAYSRAVGIGVSSRPANMSANSPTNSACISPFDASTSRLSAGTLRH